VLVCPVSFTADCLETIEELGTTARARFEASGGRLHLASCPNTYPPFIEALASLVLSGPKSLAGAEPLVLEPPRSERIAT
jgi:protoheme ferro-lyase